jgi:hypothetical protein
MALGSAASSRVGAGAPGGPFDLLQIGGSTGGPTRTVTASLGSASTVSVLQPPHLTGAKNFVIFGLLGRATLETSVTVPLGIGDMAFAPLPLVPPAFQWSWFFTFTDNFFPTAPQFVPSTPTPWTSGPGPFINFPLTITLQGVLEEAPGVYAATNAVILEIR